MKATHNPGYCTAVIAGATGLVGHELVVRLLADPRVQSLIALSRRPLAAQQPKLRVVSAEYDRLGDLLDPSTFHGRLIVFCCLGTTMAVAGSETAFRRVDHDYVVGLGRWAKAANATRMIVISALGANPSSRAFYNRVKGETESDLHALALRSLVVVRPSLLVGKRDELRLGERLALLASAPLRRVIPARVRPIAATDVAQAMVDLAFADNPPLIVESSAMQGSARRSAPAR